MAPVHAGPGVIGNEREGGGNEPGNGMPPARLEQRVVSALVQDHEPLNECDPEQDLAGEPRRPATGKREQKAQACCSQRESDDAEAGSVGRAKVDEICGGGGRFRHGGDDRPRTLPM
jgi:hypothetical protein